MKNLTSGGSLRTCWIPRVRNPDESDMETYKILSHSWNIMNILDTVELQEILDTVASNYWIESTECSMQTDVSLNAILSTLHHSFQIEDESSVEHFNRKFNKKIPAQTKLVTDQYDIQKMKDLWVITWEGF